MRWPTFILCLASAAAASAQEQSGQPFRVFFDWGKPELTRDAQATLDEAAAAYQRLRPALITVAGHTDRSGPSAVNLNASRRRAEAVKAYLAAHGVPASAITVAAYGESRPIVPTEDGVREAQNRRVEVAFGGSESATPVSASGATLIRADGSRAGTVSLTENAGGAWLSIDASGLPPGTHGMHLHAVGRCDPPDFASAGPHWNPSSRKHGSENPEGPHAGDLPNANVGADGLLKAVIAIPTGGVDADGMALVLHETADDLRTDPSGNSGARIACAAFTR